MSQPNAFAWARMASPVRRPSRPTVNGFAGTPFNCKERHSCSPVGPGTAAPPSTVNTTTRLARLRMGIAKAVTRACSVKGVPSMCDYSLHLGRIPTRQSRLANGRDVLAVRFRAAVVVEVCRHRRDDTLPAHEARHLSAALRPSDPSPGCWRSRSAPRSAVSTSDMTIKGKAYIAGIFEHPTRKADDKSLAQLHAEAA